MRSVAIHTHPALPLRSDYLLFHVVELWRQAGVRVRVIAGLAAEPSARVGILHVDLTRVPDDYLALARCYPALLNGSVVDIAKNLLGDGLVRREDAYDGPVIVKTILNYRGIPERIAMRHTRSRVARLWGSVLDHLWPTAPTGRTWHQPYPIFSDKASIPHWVWSRSDVIVQRFVPERRSGRYVQRHWFFFGDEDYHLIRYASEPMFKRGTVTGLELAGEVPSELRRLRVAMGFDFGKFDYFLHHGRPFVIDVNKTPSYNLAVSPLHGEFLRRLARGLERWL